jgi:hypothetical protein
MSSSSSSIQMIKPFHNAFLKTRFDSMSNHLDGRFKGGETMSRSLCSLSKIILFLLFQMLQHVAGGGDMRDGHPSWVEVPSSGEVHIRPWPQLPHLLVCPQNHRVDIDGHPTTTRGQGRTHRVGLVGHGPPPKFEKTNLYP